MSICYIQKSPPQVDEAMKCKLAKNIIISYNNAFSLNPFLHVLQSRVVQVGSKSFFRYNLIIICISRLISLL